MDVGHWTFDVLTLIETRHIHVDPRLFVIKVRAHGTVSRSGFSDRQTPRPSPAAPVVSEAAGGRSPTAAALSRAGSLTARNCLTNTEQFTRPVTTSSRVPPKVSKGIRSSVFTRYSWMEYVDNAVVPNADGSAPHSVESRSHRDCLSDEREILFEATPRNGGCFCACARASSFATATWF